MTDPIVRRAVPTDATALASLEQEARASLTDARGGGRWLEEHPEIGGRWASTVDSRIVLVAELPEPAALDEPGHVVGYLVLDMVDVVARVDQVYVTPEARGVGFGDTLLAAAGDEARRGGAAFLEGEALPGDRETKNLYERAGITARLITVSRRLRERSPIWAGSSPPRHLGGILSSTWDDSRPDGGRGRVSGRSSAAGASR